MSTGGYSRRQRRTFQIRKLFLESFVFSVERSLLSPYASHLSTITWRIPADCHARHSAFACAEQSYLSAEGILILVIVCLQTFDKTWNPKAGYFGKTTSCHPDIVSVRMRWIPLWRRANTPAFIGI